MREVRKSRGLGVSELAGTVGVKVNTVSDYELGKVKPSVEVLIDIANALNVSMDSFYVKDKD